MFADRLKELREDRNLTQAALARQLGITRNGVNAWEQGLSMPSTMSVVQLARLFTVSTDYLLGIESLTEINVTGLSRRDIALLSELANRLRESAAN